jgi:hypothetical protein
LVGGFRLAYQVNALLVRLSLPSLRVVDKRVSYVLTSVGVNDETMNGRIRRKLLRRYALFGCLGLNVACEAVPDAAAPADWKKRPALAASCDFVAPQVGQRDYYWLHFRAGRGCKKFVEQDECVVSVVGDCEDSNFQWAGTISANSELELKYLSSDESNPAIDCTGNMKTESLVPFGVGGTSSSFFSSAIVCDANAHHQTHIESVLPSTFVREVDVEQRILIQRVIETQTRLTKNVQVVTKNDESELWIAFSGENTDGSDAALEVYVANEGANAAQIQLSRQSVSIPGLKNVSWVPTSSIVWAGANRDILQIDMNTHSLKTVATMGGKISKVQLSPDGGSLYVAWTSSIAASTTLVQKGDLEPVFSLQRTIALPSVTTTELDVTKILFPSASSTSTPGVIVAGHRTVTERYDIHYMINTFTKDLELISEFENTHNIVDVVLVDDRERIGFLKREHRRYFEMDYEGNVVHSDSMNQEPAYFMPWMRSPATLIYSPEEKRMFIGGFNFAEGHKHDIVIGSIDFNAGKVMPEKLRLKQIYDGGMFLPLALSYDSSTKKMFPVVTNQAYFFVVDSPW